MPDTLVAFEVHVIDGETIPVPGVEIGARFAYPEAPSTWSRAVSDGDGCARFSDTHRECPATVCLYVADNHCGTYPVGDGHRIVLEM